MSVMTGPGQFFPFCPFFHTAMFQFDSKICFKLQNESECMSKLRIGNKCDRFGHRDCEGKTDFAKSYVVGGKVIMQGAAQNMPQQQQQGETMEVLQRLAQLSGANRPEPWAQLAAMTSGSAQLPPMSSGLMGQAAFGHDSAVSQALLQHYWANCLQQQQQQQQQGMPRGGSGPLANPDAILSALQAQQQQSQAGGINLPAFQQGLAALLSPNQQQQQQQQTSLPQISGASLPSEPLPTISSAPRQKRALEQLVQAAEEAGDVHEARSGTSGSCSSPDSKGNGEVKKGKKRRVCFEI